MRNLFFLILAILLINVSYAGDVGQMDDAECTATIDKAAKAGKGIESSGTDLDESGDKTI